MFRLRLFKAAEMVGAVITCFAFGPLHYEVTGQENPENRSATAILSGEQDTGDTQRFARLTWEPKADFPKSVTDDKTVTLDYPIVYIRVPRPYPKEYLHNNHLNQAGLHQTNAPRAELRLLHPDGKDESLVPVEDHESITDPMVSFDGEWVYYAKFHHMDLGECI